MGNLYIPNKLFANPSFIEGVASVVDLGATLQKYNTSDTDNEADSEALKNDWSAIGDDLRFSIKKYEQQLAKK